VTDCPENAEFMLRNESVKVRLSHGEVSARVYPIRLRIVTRLR
jgi:hypothetical protein